MAPVVDGISFSMQRGEFVGLVGESGSGKSITARSLIQLLPTDAEADGAVRIDGEDVLGLNEKRTAGRCARRRWR